MYSGIIMDHFLNPRNVGRLSTSNAQGVAGDPSAGPFMIFYLEIQAGLIQKAGFQTYGCPPAIAAGSFLSEFVCGLKVQEAAAIEPSELSEKLGGVPLGKEHCPQIAVTALRAALGAFQKPAG
jgi:nitrogen fixation NifU-like protein